jgi:hypothetical protein
MHKFFSYTSNPAIVFIAGKPLTINRQIIIDHSDPYRMVQRRLWAVTLNEKTLLEKPQTSSKELCYVSSI